MSSTKLIEVLRKIWKSVYRVADIMAYFNFPEQPVKARQVQAIGFLQDVWRSFHYLVPF